MTNDEKQRIGLFCEICRNATCICKIGYDSSITNALDDFNMNFLTPKEKAEELVFKKFGCKKQYALNTVDEIIKFGNQMGIREPMMYWYDVKQKIEKL